MLFKEIIKRFTSIMKIQLYSRRSKINAACFIEIDNMKKSKRQQNIICFQQYNNILDLF